MDVNRSFKICGSGLAAQRAKMDVVSSNLANISTTRTPEGGPYKKKAVALSAEEVGGRFDSSLKEAVQSVKVDEITEDPKVKMMYDPAHPDADAKGFVAMPDINLMSEMADMIAASRAFEACVTAFDATKSMALKTLEMGR
ncbi:MAG: flagellar basal body rod protein FlgC [Deltaproteobacteria bacterium]|nr:flagellar basal body rod protein FlgC [Deltaproteobacteria bacterium]